MSNGWKDLPNNARVGQMFRAAAFQTAPSPARYNAPTNDAQYQAGYRRGQAAVIAALASCKAETGMDCGVPMRMYIDIGGNTGSQFQRGFVDGWNSGGVLSPGTPLTFESSNRNM